MTHKNLFTTFIIVIVLLIACNSDYNTDFAPPAENPKYTDVYPESINELKLKVERIKSETQGVEGYNAIYGENKIIISAYQTPSKEDADAFFKEEIVPIFDDMSVHSRGNLNGQWYASGKEGNKKAYGWVNTNWIFVITGVSEVDFNAGIEAFKFIAPK